MHRACMWLGQGFFMNETRKQTGSRNGEGYANSLRCSVVARALLTSLVLVFLMPCHLQAAESEDAVKAAFIYNFIGFVEWPKAVKQKDEAPTICVVGENDAVIAYLEEIGSKTPVEVIKKGRDSRINDCHILYISSHNKGDVDYMVGKSQGEPILTVSDADGFVERGGVVGFFLKAGQVKIETSRSTIKKSGLVVDSELLELMTVR